MTDVDVDVVVIGGGAAGLIAALTAHEAGASRVRLFEAADRVGGAARLSMGIFVAGGSAVQARAGIDDSPDLMFRDYMTVNQWSLVGGLTRRLADESAPGVDWLERQGVEFQPELVKAGSDTRPRGAHAVGNGQAVIDVLERRAREAGIEIVVEARVDELLLEDGRVVGVRIGPVEHRARAVVIASGGFGASADKVAQHLPGVAKAGDWAAYVGPPTNVGDAFDFGAQVDAGLAGHDTGCVMMTPQFSPERETYLPGWLVVVDGTGRRFVAEDAHYSVLDRQAYLHGGRLWAILDSQALDDELASRTPSYAGSAAGYAGQAARTSPSWNPTKLREMAEQGRLRSAETLAGLAESIGVPPTQLEATIEIYGQGAASGMDAMAKAREFLRPIDQPPFYAAELRHAQIIITGAGLAIDGDARVVDRLGRAVPGLYAAGEAVGGLIWPFYPSSGSALGQALAYGRVAGRSAVSRAAS